MITSVSNRVCLQVVKLSTFSKKTIIEEFEKGNVDDRLKSIQMEDNSYAGYDETFSQELEEKVILPKTAIGVFSMKLLESIVERFECEKIHVRKNVSEKWS